MTCTLTWLGASAFKLKTGDNLTVYIDPWLHNSDCPASEADPASCDVILLSHGHFDHVGDTLALWQRFRCAVVAPQDLRRWLERQGIERNDQLGPDMGGTIDIAGLTVSLTDARHSGGAPDGAYGGAPCGLVIGIPDCPTIYFAGDTAVFSDMALIGQMYRPDIALLPIGGHYTMDPRAAVLAIDLLKPKCCIPCHYRHGPQPKPPRAILPGKPDELIRLASGRCNIVPLQPGQPIDLLDLVSSKQASVLGTRTHAS